LSIFGEYESLHIRRTVTLYLVGNWQIERRKVNILRRTTLAGKGKAISWISDLILGRCVILLNNRKRISWYSFIVWLCEGLLGDYLMTKACKYKASARMLLLFDIFMVLV